MIAAPSSAKVEPCENGARRLSGTAARMAARRHHRGAQLGPVERARTAASVAASSSAR
jgi:hypothetical protein